LTKLILYDKKPTQIVFHEAIVIDLDDLESFGNFEQGKEFLKIPSTRVGNKTIMEWFTVNDISFWWFASPIIHPVYKEAILFISRLSSFLEQNSIDLIKLRGAYDKISLVKQICQLKDVKLEISSGYSLFLLRKIVWTMFKKLAYKRITNRKFKKRLKLFKEKNGNCKFIVNPTIITSPGSLRREIFDPNTEKSKRIEFFLQPILDLLYENKMPITCFDIDYTLRGTIDVLRERLKTDFNWVPIETLLDKKRDHTVNASLLILRKSINNLIHHDLKGVFVYRNISIWDFLKGSFHDLFLEPNMPTYIHLVKRLDELFQKTKPKVIIQIYETGPYAKAFEVVAKKYGIKTVAVQHGLIPSDYADYTFREAKCDNYPYGNFVPDLTLVFGEFYKKILTERGSYLKDKVAVIGNPMYYNIHSVKKTLNRDSILAKYPISNKKIILVPLSFRFFYSKNNPDRILLDILYDGFGESNDSVILVRPHPGDKLDENNLRSFYPTKNFILSKTTLFEDLFVSDVVVVLPISTVSTEAAIFEKPVILVNREKNHSTSQINETYIHLVEHDVAILASMDEIIPKINSIKRGELWKTSESEKRKEFLYSYFNFGNSVDLMKLIYGNNYLP